MIRFAKNSVGNSPLFRHHVSQLKLGFSSVELIVVLLVIGILTALAAPSFRHSTSRYRCELAARRLAADLESGSTHARATSETVQIEFLDHTRPNGNVYWFENVYDRQAPQQKRTVQLNDSPYFCEFESAEDTIVFDVYGYPNSNGKWIIRGPSDVRFQVLLSQSSGRVTVQEMP